MGYLSLTHVGGFALINNLSTVRSNSLVVVIAVASLIAFGCQKSATEVCTDQVTLSLSMTVKDSVSGALVPNAVLLATMGAIKDSVVIGSNVEAYPVALAWGAPGTYDVSVRSPGYATWTSTATVTVGDAKCGRLAPLAITALMQKAP